jgi:hypothetical protein
VFAPGGRLAVTVWDVPERAQFVGVFLAAVAAAGAAPPADLPTGPPFFRFSDEAEMTRLLAGAGLEHVEVATVAFTHAETSAAALWDGFLAGTVRTSALILGQPEAVQQDIRAAFERLVAEFATDAGLALPVSAKLGSARKPPA